MPTANTQPGQYLLVSDSNETSNQYDSKKLDMKDLAEMAQDNLFKRHLGIMDQYMTNSQYGIYTGILEEKYDILNSVTITEDVHPKLRVVDGQVILIDYEIFNGLNESVSLVDYIKRYWDVTPEYVLIQMKDCMLRGVTFMSSGQLVVNRPTNINVGLSNDNFPPHMHHSSVTSGKTLKSMRESASGTRSETIKGNMKYDVFYNDSISTGLDFNELEGVSDNFQVVPSSDESHTTVMHNNLPEYRRYYAFVVQKVLQ